MGFNQLISASNADLIDYFGCQDNAASTTVVGLKANGIVVGGGTPANTSAMTAAGPNSWLPASLELYAGSANKLGINTQWANDRINGSFTWLAWYKPKITTVDTNDTFYGRLYSLDAQASFDVELYNGRFNLGGYVTGVTRAVLGGGNSDVNNWAHVGVTWDNSGKVARGYKNGALTGSSPVTLSAPVMPSTGILSTRIGCFSDGGIQNTASGFHAGHAAFSRALSDAEVAEIYAGPEPAWVGGGSHSLSISGTTATWSTASAAWGLPSPFASGSNGALSAEIRIKRNGVVVYSGSGFSGSGTVSNGGSALYELEVRVSNSGGYDAGQGTFGDGYKLVASTGVNTEYGKLAHYKLDETSGTIARNEVRTLIVSDEFTSGSTPGPYGTYPTGWNPYSYSLSGDEGASVNVTSGAVRITLSDGATDDVARVGMTTGTLISGKTYVAEFRIRCNSRVGSSNFQLWSGAWFDIPVTVGDWTTYRIPFTASHTLLILSAYCYAPGATIDVEIDSIAVYEENFGAYTNATLDQPGLAATTGRSIAVNVNGRVASVAPLTPALGSGSSVSFAGWVKLTAAGPDYQWVAWSSDGVIEVAPLQFRTGKPAYICGGVTSGTNAAVFTSAPDFRDGVVRHVAMVRSGNVVTCYINGVALTPITMSAPSASANTSPGSIGASGSGGFGVVGSLDDVLLYSRALTAEDVRTLVANGRSVPTYNIGLSVWYKMLETSGTTIADSSGNAVNGVSARDTSLMFEDGWLKFDGTNDYIWTPFTTSLGDFTVAALFKDNSSTGTYERILDKDLATGFWLGRQSNLANKWGGGVRDAVDPYGRYGTASDGQIHSIISRRSGTTHTIWIDGQLVASGTVSATATGTENLRIGIDNGASGKFSGWIRDVRVYPFAMTDAELVSLAIQTAQLASTLSLTLGVVV